MLLWTCKFAKPFSSRVVIPKHVPFGSAVKKLLLQPQSLHMIKEKKKSYTVYFEHDILIGPP